MRWPNALTSESAPFSAASLPSSTSIMPPSAASVTNFLSEWSSVDLSAVAFDEVAEAEVTAEWTRLPVVVAAKTGAITVTSPTTAMDTIFPLLFCMSSLLCRLGDDEPAGHSSAGGPSYPES